MTTTTEPIPPVIPQAEWEAAAASRFGPDRMTWRFVCPSCGHIASVQNWKDAGATEGEVAFSCVGRHLPNPKHIFQKPGPCNYAGGGLFGLNRIRIRLDSGTVISLFEFAPPLPGAT